MFNCDECGKTSKSCQSPHKRIVERRQVTYTNGKYKRKKVTSGWEIVKQMDLCIACNSNFEAEFPEVNA